jgi:hypothetical protein
MGLLFLSDERRDFVAMVAEVTERAKNLGLGQSQGLGDSGNRLAALMKRGHVPDRYAQAVDHWLAAADAFDPDNVRMLRLHGVGHAYSSAKKDVSRFSV